MEKPGKAVGGIGVRMFKVPGSTFNGFRNLEL
jgi:hypothetical protein